MGPWVEMGDEWIGGVDGLGRVRMDEVYEMYWLDGVDEVDRINRMDGVDEVDTLDVVDKVHRLNGVDGVDGSISICVRSLVYSLRTIVFSPVCPFIRPSVCRHF